MKPEQPLISLVILTRNRSGLLVRAVRSALGQTYAHTEVVIIDDCSEDDTQEVLRMVFADEIATEKVRIVRNESTLGQAANRNLSLDLSRGSLISYLDDDDFWFPDKIERQHEEMLKSGAKAATCGMIWMEGPTILKTTLVRSDTVAFENGGPPSTWLIDKEVMREVGGFDLAFPANVDGEFLVRLNKNYSFCYAEEPLYVHFYFPEQISASAQRKVAGYAQMVVKHGAGFSKAEFSAAYSRLAVFSLFAGEKGRHYAYKALRARASLKNLVLALVFTLPAPLTRTIVNVILDLQNYPHGYIGRHG
ncbi:MAG: glycosyltransferase family A protein [Patescibacteria group bacterium]